MNFNFDKKLILDHPHDFFRVKHLSVIPGQCYVLMPFAKKYTLVFETIKKALRGIMVCKRADELRIGKPILSSILHGIGTAELIIADLTDTNANVFYELGLAHTRTRNVLLLTQNINKVPFDLRGFFCHEYSVNSQYSLNKLAQIVREAAKEIRSISIPQMLDSPTSRTQMIVGHMKRLLESPKGINKLLLRVQASVSSIGNLNRTKFSEPDRKEYSRLLEEEGELMIRLIEKGASFEAILSPYPNLIGTAEKTAERKARIDKLIEFITAREDCMKRCQFVISPPSGTNLLFFGEELLFEGLKTGVQRGFGWTMIYTDKDFISTRIEIFDKLFESAKAYTINNYGRETPLENENSLLRYAATNALHNARKQLQ